MSKDDDAAEVVAAWTDKGSNPQFHEAYQRELRRNWPILADALDNLAISSMKVEERFFTDDRSGLVWIIITGTDEEEPHIIDVWDYEASDYFGAKDKHGNVKTFATREEARDWARKHPKRLRRK